MAYLRDPARHAAFPDGGEAPDLGWTANRRCNDMMVRAKDTRYSTAAARQSKAALYTTFLGSCPQARTITTR